ncbi:uncharacterized protein PHACADRAFT_192531 [Phanerochaete carnosa HHB-10118-sp]|uniref:Ubiquitin-like protease family profile domain-containing protein n=1 Tax=Phanerochaete carnosa (strain HHB-10118-sp) TaxID=650164 RepID=K5W852_PHACS|nr:uncharacterized protein PHACADRAFT_192531 [Phanerochaete carnosa HHB-10118-sp]EKM60133.1 hypothetical protein PHACADRAFT_192531 [Phanerochaete carnosa HHB-10118-sp]
MLAHNPLKRRAAEELLPLHSPKRSRTSQHPITFSELSARWTSIGEEVMKLLHDTGFSAFMSFKEALSDFIFGSKRRKPTWPRAQSQERLKLQAPARRITALKSSLKLPVSERATRKQYTVRFTSLPFESPLAAPHLLPAASASSPNLSPTCEDTSDSPLPSSPPRNAFAPSSDPLISSVLYPKIYNQIKAKMPRKVNHRKHILHIQFNASKPITGVRSLKDFRGWLGYQERSESPADTKSSPLFEDLRDADFVPPLSRVASTNFIQRALRDTKKSLLSPKPIVSTPFPGAWPQATRIVSEKIDTRIRRLQDTQAQVSEKIAACAQQKPLSLPISLPPEDEVKVAEIFQRRGIISKGVCEQVSNKDLRRLHPGQWLNDEIINFYGEMIMCRLKEGYEESRLARWTKQITLFSKDIILIPINHNGSHWTAAAINFRKKRIESYNSLNRDQTQVFKLLRVYLDAEHRTKKRKPFNFDGWVDWTPKNTPQQENISDCGIFACQFLETLSRGEERFAFTQANMHYLRRRMVWEIAHAKLWTDT